MEYPICIETLFGEENIEKVTQEIMHQQTLEKTQTDNWFDIRMYKMMCISSYQTKLQYVASKL